MNLYNKENKNERIAALQWNCRGEKPNYEEIKRLMKDYNPDTICLQETFIKETDEYSFKGYDMYNKSNISQIDRRPNGGSTILVRKIIPHERLPLNIELQATAIRATLHQTITICSICIPPNHWLKKSEMENLIEQLPTPFFNFWRL